MLTDSIANASIPMAGSNSKDFAKKKRANRSAKLKQCKLGVRREQWLSQVKNKGFEEEGDIPGGLDPQSAHALLASNGSKRSTENLNIKSRGARHRDERSINHYSDSDSPSNSPTTTVSGTNFTGSSGSSSSSSSGGSCSASVAGEDEEGEDGCLDDWEAVADALAATDDKQEQDNPSSEEHGNITRLESPSELAYDRAPETVIAKPRPVLVEKVSRSPNCRAWKPDDAFRPQCLPNMSKQLSFPIHSGRHYGCRGGAWVPKTVLSAPSSCPICCEDLDLTDSSFLPCSCGFRLCLFCHKRILEEDGRCPGCRKQYDDEPVKGEVTLDGGSLTFRLARSSSMITRS